MSERLTYFVALILGMAMGLIVFMILDCQAKERVYTEMERVRYATMLEQVLQNNGYEVSVTPHGYKNTELTIACEQFVNSEIVSNLLEDNAKEWKTLGFKYVTFTAGEVRSTADVDRTVDIQNGKEAM